MLIHSHPAINPVLDSISHNKRVYLRGSPGTGKTVIGWLWACLHAEKHPEQRIVWESRGHQILTILHQGKQTIADIVTLRPLLSGDIYIVDHATDEDFDHCKAALTCDLLAKIIIISSADLPFKQTDPTSSYSLQSVGVGGWSCEDYHTAVESEEFFDSVRTALDAPLNMLHSDMTARTELIEKKFFYAGFSVRWMFGLNTMNVRRCAERARSCLEDWRVLACPSLKMDLSGSNSRNGLNMLTSKPATSHIGGQAVLVSAFVVKELVPIINLETLSKMTRYSSMLSPPNPAFDEWVLKLDVQFYLIRSPLCPRVHWVVDGVLQATTDTTMVCDRFTWCEDECLRDSTNHQMDTWFIPHAWNQGFDLVQLLEVDGVPTLRFIVVTQTQAHPLKLAYMEQFLERFNTLGKTRKRSAVRVDAVEIVVLTTPGLAPSFALGAVTGALSGWNAGMLKVASFERTFH